jgi:hypothetical protein
MASMRVRIALGLAFLAAAVGLLIDMSGSAPRLAGDDHVHWPAVAFVDTVPGGGVLCAALVLPSDAARMELTIGAYGHPMPRIRIDFATYAGRTVAASTVPAGRPAGQVVSLPLGYPHGPSAAGRLCLHVGGHRPLAFGGQPGTLGGATVDGQQAQGVAILFYRPGRESWWQLLGALDQRFGLGKSPIFGDWTLPVIALAALALWFGVARVLIRELK